MELKLSKGILATNSLLVLNRKRKLLKYMLHILSALLKYIIIIVYNEPRFLLSSNKIRSV